METDAKLREVLHQGWMLKVDLEGRLAWKPGAREDMIQPVHPGGGQSWLQAHTCHALVIKLSFNYILNKVFSLITN